MFSIFDANACWSGRTHEVSWVATVTQIIVDERPSNIK